MNLLIFGNGWLANKIKNTIGGEISSNDILDAKACRAEIEMAKPEVVINAAVKTGRPNIDWCEATPENMRLTLYVNTYGPGVLHGQCQRLGVKMVQLSSGCLWGHGDNLKETDPPDPVSYYSKTKQWGDEALGGNDSDVLIMRLRMPLDDVPHQRNLITKLANYPNVLSVPNSVTVIPDLLRALTYLIVGQATGIYNVVNTGHLTGRQIIECYRRHVDQNHECEIIDKEQFEERGLATAKRSNCVLNNDKLREFGFDMPDAAERLEDCMRAYAGNV